MNAGVYSVPDARNHRTRGLRRPPLPPGNSFRRRPHRGGAGRSSIGLKDRPKKMPPGELASYRGHGFRTLEGFTGPFQESPKLSDCYRSVTVGANKVSRTRSSTFSPSIHAFSTSRWQSFCKSEADSSTDEIPARSSAAMVTDGSGNSCLLAPIWRFPSVFGVEFANQGLSQASRLKFRPVGL